MYGDMGDKFTYRVRPCAEVVGEALEEAVEERGAARDHDVVQQLRPVVFVALADAVWVDRSRFWSVLRPSP